MMADEISAGCEMVTYAGAVEAAEPEEWPNGRTTDNPDDLARDRNAMATAKTHVDLIFEITRGRELLTSHLYHLDGSETLCKVALQDLVAKIVPFKNGGA